MNMMAIERPVQAAARSPGGPQLTVLGGSGFVGRALTEHARGLALPCQAPARGAQALWHEPLGHVIYTVGLTADFRVRPLETIEAHVCLLRRLIAEADFESLTYLSSTRVYAGGSDTRETANLSVNPNDPSDLYNLSKLTGEALCLHAGRPGMKVARLSNVIGLRRDPDTFVDQLLLEAQRTGKAVMQTAPEARKDYIALDDVVALLTRIAMSDVSGIFNVASGESVANSTIASMLGEVLGIPVETAPNPARWDFSPIDIGRVRTAFNFTPRPFVTHFPQFLADYRQQKGT
ncbi:MAG: NAD(P)-dependent oxidoreductase [Rubrivivax sp.]|nr:NAD(P)-dependent oxidoreductase [Rubrivivax sp.]